MLSVHKSSELIVVDCFLVSLMVPGWNNCPNMVIAVVRTQQVMFYCAGVVRRMYLRVGIASKFIEPFED